MIEVIPNQFPSMSGKLYLVALNIASWHIIPDMSALGNNCSYSLQKFYTLK
jgi:hypothetical protein